MEINIARLGRIDYKAALMIQEKLHSLRQQNKTGDILLLVEHTPVLTLGKRGKYENILLPRQELEANGIKIHEVNRGGDVTYHGPGQIVGYPILDLNNYGRDIKSFIWKIEEVFIKLLKAEYNITSDRDEDKYTGVWVGSEKITAIGVAVKRWVTMHGFAFNVNTDLEHFKWINPCGITDKGVTSLQQLLGHPADFDGLNGHVARYFCEVFGLEPEILSPEQLHSILERE